MTVPPCNNRAEKLYGILWGPTVDCKTMEHACKTSCASVASFVGLKLDSNVLTSAAVPK